MTSQPSWFEAEFDENGRLLLSDDVAARLGAQLGHDPQPGDKVTLALVEDADLPPASEDFERWLQTDAVASIEDMRAHPEHNLTIDQVREHFAAKLAAARAADHE